MRQSPPGATVSVTIKDGVDDLTQTGLARPSERPILGKRWFEDRPLGVGQVT
jgi:hypothetical protein